MRKDGPFVMGMFFDFMIRGFKQRNLQYYSPGTLFEVMSRLGEELKMEQMRSKVMTLLSGWFTDTSFFRKQNKPVPAYGLEIHAINDKKMKERDGYSTYVFVPDDRLQMVINPMTSIFSKPIEVYDEEDPLKALSDIYSDDNGMSTNESLSIYELTCEKDDFYPLNPWNKQYANDPLEEIFGVFDNLKPGEFAGISFVIIPPEPDWEVPGKMRIRYIEDEDYEEEIGFIETVKRFATGQDMPQEEVERLAGYKKQQLDDHEREEVKVIQEKLNGFTFRTSLRIYASTPDIAENLAGIIMQKANGKWNSLCIADKNGNLRDLAMRKEGKHPFLMSAEEIAAIWHVPAENTMGEKLHKPLPAALTPPEELLAIDIGEPGDIQKLIYSIR